MQLVQAKIGEFIHAFQKMLVATERAVKIKEIKAEIEPVIRDALEKFRKNSTDSQRFISAAMIFDMCLNVPDKRN